MKLRGIFPNKVAKFHAVLTMILMLAQIGLVVLLMNIKPGQTINSGITITIIAIVIVFVITVVLQKIFHGCPLTVLEKQKSSDYNSGFIVHYSEIIFGRKLPKHLTGYCMTGYALLMVIIVVVKFVL